MVPKIDGCNEEVRLPMYFHEFVQYLIKSLYNSHLFLNHPFLMVAEIAQSIH